MISSAYPDGVTSAYTYDGLSRPTSVTGPAVTNRVTDATHTSRTSYGYDPDGNLLTRSVADSTGGDATRTTAYAYDGHGELSG